jgi:hypothetical protein
MPLLTTQLAKHSLEKIATATVAAAAVASATLLTAPKTPTADATATMGVRVATAVVAFHAALVA